jgi:hypothetical protein
MTDQTVRHANALTTTFLDALGVLLLAAGIGWSLWVELSPAAGMCAAGAVVLLMSMVAQQRQTPRGPTEPVPEPSPDLPGPADPGNLHVMGR